MIASTAAYKPGPSKNRPQIMINTCVTVFTLRAKPLNKLPLYICQYATAKKMKPKNESKAAPERC